MVSIVPFLGKYADRQPLALYGAISVLLESRNVVSAAAKSVEPLHLLVCVSNIQIQEYIILLL